MNFEGVIVQVLQPYFFYSIFFLFVSFICVKIFLRLCPFVGERTKSLLYIIPLVVPLLVMAIFLPSTTLQVSSVDVVAGPALSVVEPSGLPIVLSPDPVVSVDHTMAVMGPISSRGTIASGHISPVDSITSTTRPFSSHLAGGFLVTSSQVTILSFTGICCIIGLVVGAFFALTMVVANDRIARRILRVILLSADERPWLQSMLAESSKKLAIACPKVGVVEDLRPNAFTIGYGRGATVVFSMGLLNLLDKEEVAAVALHELAHIKHNDLFFKTVTSALVAISFFNPVAFITASVAQRRREMFADEGAVVLLEHPYALSSALTKICSSLKTLPETGLFDRSSVGLMFTSSVFFRSGILATHPRLTDRLGNISMQKSGSMRLSKRSIMRVMMLSVMLLSFFVMSSYAVVELQHTYCVNVLGPVGLVGHTIGSVAVGGGEFPAEHMVISQSNMLIGAQGSDSRVLCQNGRHYFDGAISAPYIKQVD